MGRCNVHHKLDCDYCDSIRATTHYCRGCDRNLPGGNFSEGRLLCKTCVNRKIANKEEL